MNWLYLCMDYVAYWSKVCGVWCGGVVLIGDRGAITCLLEFFSCLADNIHPPPSSPAHSL